MISEPVQIAERKDRAPGPVTRKILVATDFSPASARALDQAVALANQCRAELTILHVIDINTQAPAETAQEVMTRLWHHGSAQIGHLAGSLSGQVHAQTVIEEGLPSESILRRSQGFDLVIVGQAASRRRWQLFSKHTVERVLERSACPVLVVRDSD
jgi:nucleotide-binding universal stress UspA family protein